MKRNGASIHCHYVKCLNKTCQKRKRGAHCWKQQNLKLFISKVSDVIGQEMLFQQLGVIQNGN